jgi:hypothetical protein
MKTRPCVAVVALQPPAVTLRLPSVNLPQPSITLQLPSVTLQLPSVTLQPPRLPSNRRWSPSNGGAGVGGRQQCFLSSFQGPPRTLRVRCRKFGLDRPLVCLPPPLGSSRSNFSAMTCSNPKIAGGTPVVCRIQQTEGFQSSGEHHRAWRAEMRWREDARLWTQAAIHLIVTLSRLTLYASE